MNIAKWLNTKKVIVTLLSGERLNVDVPDNLGADDYEWLRQNKQEILRHLRTDINAWLEAIKICQSQEEIFQLLNDFRKLPNWLDNERSLISHAYHQRLEQIE